MATPPGWAQDSKNSKKYNATLPPVKSSNFAEDLSKSVTVQVDNTTGVIGLVADGAFFYQYDPKLNKWKIPTEGDEYFDDIADQTDVYISLLKDIGTDGLNKITSTAKTEASKVISTTSTPEAKSDLSETNAYVSALKNTANINEIFNGEAVQFSPDDTSYIENLNFDVLGGKEKYGSYAYPRDMFENKFLDYKPDVVRFKQYRYGKRSVGNYDGLGPLKRRNNDPVDGDVTLAIPPGIQDNSRVNWNNDEMNSIQLELAKSSLDIMNNPIKGVGNMVDKAKAALGEANTQNAIKTALAAKAVGANNLLPRLSGAILNPNTELLFSGPGLRDFNYTIEMAPRDADEAKIIRNIIRFFKEGMAPRRTSTGGLFLKSPNVFSIEYLFQLNGEEKPHPYINKVKGNCALRNCAVDYTPQNTYMSHKADGSMLVYRMTLQFSELEPVYYDDYKMDKKGSHGMGY